MQLKRARIAVTLFASASLALSGVPATAFADDPADLQSKVNDAYSTLMTYSNELEAANNELYQLQSDLESVQAEIQQTEADIEEKQQELEQGRAFAAPCRDLQAEQLQQHAFRGARRFRFRGIAFSRLLCE